MFVDTFTSLDGLTRAQAKDDLIVLAALKVAKRFSCWDMDDSRQLWRAVNRLKESGHITVSHRRWVKGEANEPAREEDTYPWSSVTLTAAGEGRLIASKVTTASAVGRSEAECTKNPSKGDT